MTNITIVGTGYVGLVSGVCFAALGHRVTCIDTNTSKIQGLQNGIIPIYEPGLEELVRENAAAGRLFFSDKLTDHVTSADAVFIAVGTPTAVDGISADLSYVYAVAREIAPLLNKYTVVVTKSTVPVLTNRAIEEEILSINPSAQFGIASNPEFLREGCAIDDFMKPDRIVVGVREAQAQKVMTEIYAPLTAHGAPLLFTSPESAELIKYASNAFLAAKVAFINEVADLAEQTGGDIADISKGVGLDSRIGSKFLQAGPGYGGSCFPKDTRAFAYMAAINNVPSSIIEAVIASNDSRKEHMATRIIGALGGDVKGKKIAIWGVTFKANTDDMRESVALNIIPQLLQAGAQIHACDPAAAHQAHGLLPRDVQWHDDALQACDDADVLVLMTEWPQFKEVSLAECAKRMKQPLLIDLRNFFDVNDVAQAGFDYRAIGRGAPVHVIHSKKVKIA